MKPGIKDKLKIEASIHALSGLLSNPNIIKELDVESKFMCDLAMTATSYADTLIDQLEEEEELWE
jgi:hypothetical protein